MVERLHLNCWTRKQLPLQFPQIQISVLSDAIFVHRIRDIDPKIRKEAINSLCTWICALPAHFEKKILILSSALSDEGAVVREAVLEALVEIFTSPECHSTLRVFLSLGNNVDLNKIIDFCLYDLAERIEMLPLRLVQAVVCEVKIFAFKGEFEKLKMLVFHLSVFV